MDKWAKSVDVICYGDLTTFPTRKIARDFYFSGMCGTEGAERNRYTDIVIGLESTDNKMVHDGESSEKNPIVYFVSKFKGDYCGERKRIEKPMPYNEYIHQQKLKDKDRER